MTFVVQLLVHRLEAESLLDIGCGDGRLLNMVSGQIPHLVGVDLVEEPILFARAFNPSLKFYIGDVYEVPGQFHITSLIEVMEHIPDDGYPEFIQKVAQKTRPDGRLVVSVPTINTSLNKKHYRHYSFSLLQEQLRPAFVIEDHWFIFKQGLLSRVLKRALQPYLGIIMPGIWRRMIWRIHKKLTYMADATNGGHLIAIAKHHPL